MSSTLDAQPVVIVNPYSTSPSSTAIVNSDGSTIVTPATRNFYSIGLAGLSLATSATDFLTISGSSTKTVIVRRIEITGIKTTGGQELIALIKRTSANSGGTSAIFTPAQHDSQSPAATAVVTTYSANPTSLGNGAGFYRCVRVFWPATTSVTAPSVLDWDFTSNRDPGLILRGTSEFCCINMQGGSVAGDTIFATVDWTEE